MLEKLQKEMLQQTEGNNKKELKVKVDCKKKLMGKEIGRFHYFKLTML